MLRLNPKLVGFASGIILFGSMLIAFQLFYASSNQKKTIEKSWPQPENQNTQSEVGVSIKGVKPGHDGNLELTLSLKLADIVQFLDSFTNGGGELDMNRDPTSNAIVPDIKILINPKSNLKIYPDGSTAIVFIVGKPSDNNEQMILDTEYQKYGDIIQGDFLDTYRNLTLKTILGLKWIATHCSHSQYYIKADDDAFINVFEWMNMAEKARKQNNRFIMCPMWLDKSMPILRDPEKCMKWCVKYTEFPGLALMMSGEIIKEMYETAKKTRFFWIDDVFLTGIVSRKLPNVYYHSIISNFTLKANLAHMQYIDPNKKITYQLSHVKDYKQFNDMWTSLLKRVSSTIH